MGICHTLEIGDIVTDNKRASLKNVTTGEIRPTILVEQSL